MIDSTLRKLKRDLMADIDEIDSEIEAHELYIEKLRELRAVKAEGIEGIDAELGENKEAE